MCMAVPGITIFCKFELEYFQFGSIWCISFWSLYIMKKEGDKIWIHLTPP